MNQSRRTTIKKLGISGAALSIIGASNLISACSPKASEKQEAKELKISHLELANKDTYVLKKLLVLIEDEIDDIVKLLDDQNVFTEVKFLIKKFNINYYHNFPYFHSQWASLARRLLKGLHTHF